jgi:hypothetical protein
MTALLKYFTDSTSLDAAKPITVSRNEEKEVV